MMQVAMTNALNMLRGTPSQQALTASNSSDGDSRIKLLQRANEALDNLKQGSKSSADIAKERAARKLAELQQQLEMLKSGGLSPEAVARLAAELSQKIAAVASQFASAIATASVGTVATATPESAAGDAEAASSAAATADAVSEASSEPTTKEEEPVDAAQARKAYQETAADGEQQSSGVSDEDRRILEKLKSLLRDVRQVLEKAMRDVRNGRNEQSEAAPAMPAAVSSAGTPVSIII